MINKDESQINPLSLVVMRYKLDENEELKNFKQRFYFDGSAVQKKIVRIALADVAVNDTELRPVVISIEKLLKLLNLSDGGVNYRKLKEKLNRSIDIAMYNESIPMKDGKVKSEEGRYKKTLIFSSIEIDLKTNLVYLELNEKLKDFLIGISRSFVAYRLGNILSLSGKYSIPAFEYFKRNAFRRRVLVTADELKEMFFGTEIPKKYQKNSEFFSRIIAPAIDEVNKKTELNVSMTKLGRSRDTYSEVLFDISEKSKQDFIEVKRDVWGLSEEEILRDIEYVKSIKKLNEEEKEKRASVARQKRNEERTIRVTAELQLLREEKEARRRMIERKISDDITDEDLPFQD